MKAPSWINFILGLWLIATPFAMHYGGTATLNNVIIGMIVAVLALIRALESSSMTTLQEQHHAAH